MNGWKVRVAREWNRKEISIDLAKDNIEISLPLESFLTALAAEMGSPASRVTRSGLLKQLNHAAAKIVSDMKMETVKRPIFGAPI